MTFKLTQLQAEQLDHLFIKVINPEKPENIAESLIKDHMTSIYRKLRAKREAKLIRQGYSLTLNDMEAKAFYLYFQNRYLGEGWRYEQIMIDAHLRAIDQLYA